MKKLEIIAPAFRLGKKELKQTREFLDSYEFSYKFPKEEKDLICSAPLSSRIKDFKEAFKKKDTDFIWCLRGGYGSHQLLSHIKPSDIKQKKTLMGFSDSTSLHYYLNQVCQLPTLHGPHANSFIYPHSPQVLKETLQLMKNPEAHAPLFKGLKRLNKKGKSKIKASLVGGNLATLMTVIGTAHDKGVKGKILFLEDVAEYAYKINRMLEHMTQAGFFKGVKAVVFGGFSHESAKEQIKIQKFLKLWAEQQNFPVLTGMQAGHVKMNRPFWFGKRSLLDLDCPLDQKVSLHNNV